MKTRFALLATALLLGACGGDDIVDLQDMGTLRAHNTTSQDVTEWHYRPCGSTSYSSQISLSRLPNEEIVAGGTASVQIEGDRCFDHRFTLESGVFAEELDVTVPKLGELSINIVAPDDDPLGN